MITDTYRYGQIWIDANLTIDRLSDEGRISDDQAKVLDRLQEFSGNRDFYFLAEDWDRVDQLPRIVLETFGSYENDALDRANVVAITEWADRLGHLEIFNLGYNSVALVADWEYIDLENLEEALELLEGYYNYPVLDEELWSKFEAEEWEDNFRDEIHSYQVNNDVELTGDMISEIRDHLLEDLMDMTEVDTDELIRYADRVVAGDNQAHQDAKLF